MILNPNRPIKPTITNSQRHQWFEKDLFCRAQYVYNEKVYLFVRRYEKRLEEIIKKELTSCSNRLFDGRVDINGEKQRKIMKRKDIKQKKIFEKHFPGCASEAVEWIEFIDNVF